MEGRQELCPFAVRVEGDWGATDPPKSVRNKLLRYFQSRKKSGGGECELQLRSGHLLACFAEEEVRQRVLSQRVHELDVAGNGKLVLTVTLHETAEAPAKGLPKEKRIPEQASKKEDRPEERAVQESLQKVELSSAGVNPCHDKDISENLPGSSLVVLENVKESITHETLTLLVENISCLSGEDDFKTELLRERKAAVVTFQRNNDAANFLDRCAQNARFKSLKMIARSLEVTKMIKIENMPPAIYEDFIVLYFESAKHGGGQVSNVKMFPEEDSAIVTFCDHQVVQTVLEKRHSFERQPVSVYPYYSSLNTVLYGNERPQVKMPEPVKLSLDPHIWKFIQTQHKLVEEINKEMGNCCCELTWPQVTCHHPEVILCPSAALSKEASKSWKDKVSMEFACIMSKFKVVKCKIIPATWDTINNTLMKGDVLAIPDDHKETVTLAGFVFTVDGMEKLVREHVENVIKNEEKAKQTVEETVSVTPGKYAVLHCVLLKENVYKKNPDLKLSYDPSAKILQLRGLNVEVYKMKSVILERLHKMEEKQVNIHTSIFQFLQHASNKNVYLKIFGANNINASYELAPDGVVLVGCSPEVLWKAEEQMKQDLDYKQISLDDQGILNKREWKELVRQLQKQHNSSEVAVIIDDCLLSGQEGKVSIAGYRKAVAEVYQALSEFVGRNTPMMKEILAKCVAVVKFVEKEKGEVWRRLRKKGVKIEFGPQAKLKSIMLNGSKAEVPAAAALVEELLSSVNSLTVVIDKPGVKSFFKNREHSYITEVKQTFGCLIRLQEDGEDTSKGFEKKMGPPHSEIKLKDGVVIIVRKGDLTHYPVDVVVNASNEDLQHIGGLAEALLKAAGHKLQIECDEVVRRYGRLKPGRAVITSAGNLLCKQVIHAVGPRWKYEEREKCVLQLKKVVRESLRLAETYNHHSIAIPAISSGIFGFPLKECAHSIVTAIKESLEESSESGCVKKICLVDLSDNTIQALTDALNKVFKDGSLQPKSLTPPQKDKQPSEKLVRGDLPVVYSPEGLKLKLVEKGIEKAMTDVVVGSIGDNLKLGVGPLSKALLKKAGSQLQVEFDQVVQQGQQAPAGHTIQTGGYNLTSKFVLHAVVPAWNAGKGNGMKVLRDIVKECLEKTEALSLNSISFPAIGTGGFGFPKSEVAKLMFEEVLQFSSRKNVRSLQEVHFLLHPNDVENIKAFYEVFGFKSSMLVPQNDGQNAGFFGPISTPVLGIHEMQIGMIKFQVATGDITKEDTDIIVNISNANFNAKSGVSKAILEGAGPQVEMECELQASQPNNGFITTQGGNLICKNIIHLIPDSDINSQVSKVLQECELKKYSSVAFPAIGTGQGGKSPENAADEMIGAIADFAGNKSPHHVKVIKIVIFQPHMQNAFYSCMKNKEGSSLPSSTSLWSRVKSFVSSKIQPTPKKRLLLLETKLEAAVFEICGEHKKNVEDTEVWLKQLILQEQEERRISDVLIDMFDEEEIKQLNDLQRRLHIAIHLDKKQIPPSILVSGITRHVLEAQMKIQNLIQRIKDDREEESKAKLAQNLVEWQYSLRGDLFLPFSLLDNLHLEDAKVNNNREVKINLEGRSFKADVKNMTATDSQGTSISIRRLGKEEGKLLHGLPKNWEDMNGALVKSVALQPSTPEYQDVEQKFRATCRMQKIEKIERIQNPYLWQSYKVKKEEMDNKNGHRNNEKVLFHGTPSSAITPINQTGFDRGYAGKNAAMIGNGTYFAVHANYSAQDTYSTPDASGRKFMFLARVLTGDFTIGKRNQIAPPSKTPGGFDWYNSVTDNLANPSMFVIFHDTQAYPEYLITFRN